MPPRRHAAIRGAPAPIVEAPLATTLQAVRVWSLEGKAVGSTLVGLAILILAVQLQPSESTMVARALSSQTRLAMPQLARFVERREMSAIVSAVEQGGDYIVVDGGNRVGKSVAVEVAASRLSGSRSVHWSACDEGDTAAVLLRRLFGLDDAATSLSRIFAGVAKLLPPVPPSVADIRKLVLSPSSASAGSSLEPVLVVEMAERLEVKELKSMLDFAKELADKRRGRFIFVFSPTENLDEIRRFGSLARAKVVHVGDLSDSEATSFLAQVGCSPERASALYALVGGHLPHLVTDTAREYCRGTLALSDVNGVLFADIDAQVEAVDRVLGTGSACRGLCGVQTKDWPKPGVLDMLLKEHLVVAALRKGILLDSKVVISFADARCHCVAINQ